MMKYMVMLTSLLLVACNQSKVDDGHTQANQENQANKETQQQISTSKKLENQALAMFSYQDMPDQTLSKQCLWTDDAHAEGKSYLSIVPSPEINGKSIFTEDDVSPMQLVLRQAIQNCKIMREDHQKQYAYAVNDDREWVNTIAIKSDRVLYHADKTISVDLDKNGKPEQLFACYNHESIDVFFKETLNSKLFEHVNVQLSYGIDGEIEPELACGNQFYQKLGIVAQEDNMTGEMRYKSR